MPAPLDGERQTIDRPPTAVPRPPQLPAELELATVADHDLEDEASFSGLEFAVTMPERIASAVEFEECRFRGADLSGGSLPRARFTDCQVEASNLANLRAEKAAMVRVELTGVRMTGFQWVDGGLHDVRITGCRADLAGFWHTRLRRVRFEKCNLTRAHFQNSDLTGAEFVDCDLTGAQFSEAAMAGARFQGCVLEGLGGITSLRGARFAETDLASLAYSLAAGLGIEIDS